MTAKPETAAEVLAEMLASAKEENHLSYSEAARFADRLERALSAQGEAVGEVTDYYYGSPVVRWDRPRETNIGTKLYTHPAPARVTEEAVERGWKAFVMSFGDLATPEEYLNHCSVNEMAELKKAIRAVLEADHGP